MGEQNSTDSAEGNVKRVLTWGSVAYAFGFATVMLHTYRLRMPVIELIHPIYVWVGLPLATVAFFFKHIAAAFRRESSRLAAEVRSGWSQTATTATSAELDIAAELVGLVRAVPLVGWIVGPFMLRMVDKAVQQAKASDPKLFDAGAKHLRRMIGASRLVLAGLQAVNLVSFAALLCLLLFAYVWVIYPSIPQSLGGGKPSSVQLVVEANSLPEVISALGASASASAAPSEKATVRLRVELLYLTKEAYYVETNGIRLSIKADAVKSIIW